MFTARQQTCWKVMFSVLSVCQSFCPYLSASERLTFDWNAFLLPPANEVCKGYVFTHVCLSTGGHVCQGVCMAGGHVWQGACMAGGVHGKGACMARGRAWQGGMHRRGCVAGGMHGRGCAWWGGACMPWQIPRDTVNERAVHILLECILVENVIFLSHPYV